MPDFCCSDPGTGRLPNRRTVLGGIAATVLTGLAARPSTAHATEFADSFDRPDGSIGEDWVAHSGEWRIDDGRLVNLEEPRPDPVRPRLAAWRAHRCRERHTFGIDVAVLDPVGRWWSGIATNVTVREDVWSGYLLRIAQTTERPGHWQFGQVRDSEFRVLYSGSIDIPPGTTHRLTLESTSWGVFEYAIVRGGEDLLRRVDIVPLADLVSGGHVAAVSDGGNTAFDNAELILSGAGSAPDPGPFQHRDLVGPPYQLPDAELVVAESSLVGTSWSGCTLGQVLVTNADDEYVAYYTADREIAVAHRRSSDSTWTTRLTGHVAEGWDSHNYLAAAVDSSGNLHVAGDHHGDPLNYFRTAAPGDLSTLVRVETMVDPADELRVTYPTFLTSPTGQLVFRHRSGGSGNGSDFYNIYDTTTATWSRLLDTPLHDGEGMRNAYVRGPDLGPDGNYHLTWTWRDTGDAATNQNVCYARSRDLVHWETSSGEPVSLPITFDTSEVVDRIPMNGGLLNGNTYCGFDADGKVMISYFKYDSDGCTQLFVARRERQGWRRVKVSDWTGRLLVSGTGSLNFPLGVQRCAPLPDGRVRLPYSYRPRGGRTLILEPDTLRPHTEVDTPAVAPAEVTDLRSGFVHEDGSAMTVRTSAEWSRQASDGTRRLLRWEALPTNNDRPRAEPWPPPSDLQVYRLATQPEAG